MPRDTAGNYTLPAGNPVASGEIISASWANSTMNDLGQSLSASLDRYGRGGMLAPFQFTDGTESAPGATWSNEPTTGLYRAAYGDLRFTLTGTDVQRWTSANSYLWRNSQWEEILTSTAGGSTTLNDLVVTGSFTSPGIDDNATATAITIDGSSANQVTLKSTTSPVEVVGLLAVPTSGYNHNLQCMDSRAFNTSGNGGGIGFGYQISSSENYEVGAVIQGYKDNNTSGDVAGGLSFSTRVNNQNPRVRMTISSSGDVGIGTDAPVHKLHVLGNYDTAGFYRDVDVDISGTAGNWVQMGAKKAGVETASAAFGGVLEVDGLNGSALIQTRTGGTLTEKMRITAGGVTQVTGGFEAAQPSAGQGSYAAGGNAGLTGQGEYSTAVGWYAGSATQGSRAVAVGTGAGQKTQGNDAVSVGNAAGYTNQGASAVAVGREAGNDTQSNYAVAVGISAGQTTQGDSAVAVGYQAGKTTQSGYTVAVGVLAGESSQGESAVGIGNGAGRTSQGDNSTAIGKQAGLTSQGISAVAVGSQAGKTSQDQRSVAVGSYSGEVTQGAFSVALGDSAGRTDQGDSAVAIGHLAGGTNQSASAVAVGLSAGTSGQQANAIAIGQDAGTLNQQPHSIAIGTSAGAVNQGANGIIISSTGVAGTSSQPNHIVLQSGATQYLYYNGTNLWEFAGGNVTVPNDNLLVGTTSPNSSSAKVQVAGSISVSGYLFRADNCGFAFGTNIIYPVGSSNSLSNGSVDLGASGNKFKDAYLSGTVKALRLNADHVIQDGAPVIDAKGLINTLSTLRQATMDETQDIRESLRLAIDELIDGFEQEIATMPAPEVSTKA